MDIIEVNKITRKKNVERAYKNIMSSDLQSVDAITLVVASLKKEYGVRATVNIIHRLGVKHL